MDPKEALVDVIILSKAVSNTWTNGAGSIRMRRGTQKSTGMLTTVFWRFDSNLVRDIAAFVWQHFGAKAASFE